MIRRATTIGLLMLLVPCGFAASARAAPAPMDPAAFHDDMRKLWEDSAYDEVHGQILKMADMLSAGIVKQFPSKFKKT